MWLFKLGFKNKCLDNSAAPIKNIIVINNKKYG